LTARGHVTFKPGCFGEILKRMENPTEDVIMECYTCRWFDECVQEAWKKGERASGEA